jgi:hypothetical protein
MGEAIERLIVVEAYLTFCRTGEECVTIKKKSMGILRLEEASINTYS